MKTKITLLFILFSLVNFGQTYKILNDRAIVGHHKRMVFQKWGDWYPKPVWKKILGVKVQVNFPASAVWKYSFWGLPNFITPKRNRQYKKGKDIRPLKSTGLQNQRLVERKVQEEEAQKSQKSSKELLKKARRDFVHWTKTLANVDPLWLLYYKTKLKPLDEMKNNPSSFEEWKFDNANDSQESLGFINFTALVNNNTYNKMKKNGSIKHLQELLDLMKHNYKVARNVDMPRGKRILLYHKILLDWRKFKNYQVNYLRGTREYVFNELRNAFSIPNYGVYENKSDKQIVKEVVEKWEKVKNNRTNIYSYARE